MMGVQHTTIMRDLNTGANAPSSKYQVKEYKEIENKNGANAPPPVIEKPSTEIIQISAKK